MIKKIIFQLTTVLVFILAAAALHAALNVTMPSPLINISLLILSIFLTLQACSRVDKSLGLGKYSQDQDDDFDSCQGNPTNNTTQEETDSHTSDPQPNAYNDIANSNTNNNTTHPSTDIPLNDDTNLID